jgi:ABC-type antimicrobial peptide transport system permease subunit
MSTRATWVFTVVSDTTSSSAISAFDKPRAINLKTSSSRGVSSSNSAGTRSGTTAPRENSWIRRFAVPAGSLVAFTIVAAVAGTLAAIGPARRAARLDVLKALQYE